MFKTPEIPQPQQTFTTTAAADIDRSVEQERRRQARKKGRSANLFSSDYTEARASDVLGV